MSDIYNKAYKIYPYNENKKYLLYIRFNNRVDSLELAKRIKRTIGEKTDFGSDKNNTLSMSFIYRNRCKNFMLEMKKLILKDEDVKEVCIRQIN